MPSLENRVAHRRDTLITHSAGIRLCGKRIHSRLRNPVVLIPAFLSGMLIARAAPVLRRVLPELTERLRNVSQELSKLDATIRLIAALEPVLRRPPDTETEDTERRPPTR